MLCKYGEVKHITGNEQTIVFEYLTEKAGLLAADCAFQIVNDLAGNKPVNIEPVLEKLRRIKAQHEGGATSNYILGEARKRNIPIRKMGIGSLVTLGYGKRQKKLRTAVADTTSGLGIELAGNKEETKAILRKANVPVPRGIVVETMEEMMARLHEVRYPLAIKPLNGNQGRGVTTRIHDEAGARFGFSIAQQISEEVIIEEFIEGYDHRFLVIDFKLVAVAMRVPASIRGDGSSTIQQLIDKANADPQRGNSAEHVLALIKVDEVTRHILAEKSLSLSSVLKPGEELVLKETANISAGGTAVDVTDSVHEENRFIVERIARIFNLDICGIDIITKSVAVPFTRETGAVIEVNAGPGVRMHSNPQSGKARNVAAPIIDMLFPSGKSRIPMVAVTGGTTAAEIVRAMESLAALEGNQVGSSTRDTSIINGHPFKKENTDDFENLQDLLFDPMINFAVMECSANNTWKNGLPFETCDVAIVEGIEPETNINGEIFSPEELSRIQMVLPLTVKKEGYAILNADNDLVYKMYSHLDCKIALYSMDADNLKIDYHRKRGGAAAVFQQGYIVVYDGDWSTKIRIREDQQYQEHISVFLPVSLAGVVMNFKTDLIRECFSKLRWKK